MKILILTDNKNRAQRVKETIKDLYTVDITQDLDEVIVNTKQIDYVVVLIAFYGEKHPYTKEVEAAKYLRKNGVTGAILTILAAEFVRGRIALLDAGVDYFLMRPYYSPEFRARLKALRRRDHSHLNISDILNYKSLSVDLSARTITVDGDKVTLTRKEFDVLYYLVKNAGHAVTRDMILNNVWELGGGGEYNTIDVHIKMLRDKIDKPYGTRYIKTAYGIGYRFA